MFGHVYWKFESIKKFCKQIFTIKLKKPNRKKQNLLNRSSTNNFLYETYRFTPKWLEVITWFGKKCINSENDFYKK